MFRRGYHQRPPTYAFYRLAREGLAEMSPKSITPATPNPCAYKWSRKRMVDSQSMTGSSPPPAAGEGDAATWAAAKTFRRAGGGYPAAQPGSGTTSGPDPGARPA